MDRKIFQPISRPKEGAAGKTGSWRTIRPVYDAALCNDCQICWLFCPEAAIGKEDRKIAYDYCKGCGICAAECSKGAIVMIKEEAK